MNQFVLSRHTITTPDPQQYLVLVSRYPLTPVQNGSGYYYVERFHEIVFVNGARRVRLPVDESVPAEWIVPDSSFGVYATLLCNRLGASPDHLDEHHRLDLRLHLSSPLVPRARGLWLQLTVAYDKGKGGLHFTRGEAGLHDGEKWETFRSMPPQWLTSEHGALWELENGASKRRLSRENTLLATDWSDPVGKAALAHIDPALRGAQKNDYRFGLRPVEQGDATEICAELVVREGFGQPPLVSDYALLLSDERRAGVPLGARGLHLRSAVVAADGFPTGWRLAWLGVPGAAGSRPRHAFSLESFSQLHLNAHAFGLATTHARNRMSFIPTWIATADASASCDMVFEVRRQDYAAAETRLRQVLFGQDTAVRMTCGGALDVAGAPLEWIVLVRRGDPLMPPPGERFLAWELYPAARHLYGAEHRFGAGSVLLEADAAAFKQGKLFLAISPQGQHYRRGPLEASLYLDFESTRLRPLSMDPEVGFETISSVVERARPWTIDLGAPQTGTLTIRENATRDQSRQLRLTVGMPDQDTRETDAVLVDTSPFTVVRVQTSEKLARREIYAEYVDDADQAAEWRFFSETGNMIALLPPQGIGEEMVKGHLIIDGQAVPAGLFDFRLTPPARLELDRTDIATARSEAPWSLRRLLVRRSGTTGVKLERARFELLYGMEARLQAPALRVAELEGFVGRVPYPQALWDAYRGRYEGKPDSAEEAYAVQVAGWQGALWRRPSWWRVFRDATDRSRMLLDSGIEYRLRPTRQTAHPFAIASHASAEGADTDHPGRQPLRGGVDWPFQSPNVYNELRGAPASSSGAIEGLVFGSLGGEGTQTASFNNGKTMIISSSRQGRLDSLTLIRVGRIAMMWNKARHVVVYERTTRRAPRYDYAEGDDGRPEIPLHDDLEVQPPLAGIAALRKVREYIEITEARRRYPDSSTERPAAGPLVQCTFATTVIPVMSSWGRDVKQGFAITLRGPIPVSKEAFFPDPQAYLDFARASGKGGGFVSQRIQSTDRLVFFTSTRAEDGGDSDQWPAWPDIDHPAYLPPPAPTLPFRSGFQGARQPDAEHADPLMERFTFELERAEEGANLMHGRQSPGLEAKLTNVCMARGMPLRSAVAATPELDAAQRAVDTFSASRAVMIDGLRDLAWGARARAARDGGASVAADARFRRDLDDLLRQLQAAAKDSPVLQVDPVNWEQQQQHRGEAFLTNVAVDAQALGKQLVDQLRVIQAAEPADLARLRMEAGTLVNAVGVQARERLGTLGLVGADALLAARDLLGNWLETGVLRLSRLEAGATSALANLEQRIAAEPDRLAELEAAWREQMARIPSELHVLSGSLAQLSEGAAGKFFSTLEPPGMEGQTLQARARSAVEPVVAGAADWLARWLDALAPFEVAPPDFPAMRRQLAGVLNPDALRGALEGLKGDIAALMQGLGDWDKTLDSLRRKLEQEAGALQEAIGNADDLKTLAAEVRKYAQAIGDRLTADAKELVAGMKIDPHVQQELERLQGRFDALGNYKQELDAALAGIRQAVDGSVGELEARVRTEVARAEQYLQAGARQLEDWARGTMVKVLEIGQRETGAALEAVRILAEGPITEGLKVTRDQVGYYYQTALETVGLTPASAVFNDLGREALNALSANVPFDRLGERLLPKLEGLLVRDLFGDFCGIKLTDLLPDLDIKLDDTHHYDWLTVQHGFDKQRLSAWARVLVNKKFDQPATLFDLGPVKLRLLQPLFFAQADIVNEGGRQRQLVYGRLEADFELSLNDKPMVTMAQGRLAFDERGKLDFKFDAENLELADELRFISDAVQALMPQVEGLALTPLAPAGIDAQLCLPLPDIGTGAFTLTGVTLNANLGLLVGDGFEIRTGLWLSKPERPFGLAILFLGGGGWFGIEARYKPPQQFVTRVSVGISAGAFAALNFGFAAGSAGLLFTAGIDFYRDWSSGSGGTDISLGILMWGEFSILGIASAGIRLTMRVQYTDQGGMIGTGTLSVKIKICWCYTLRVNRSVTKVFSGGSGAGQRRVATPATAAPALLELRFDDAASFDAGAPDIRAAVAAYFDTLAT